ncbi:hypothetical protein niasHS_010736 [Heterodera schachtii]|uniref:Macroglobulin domain-containing protein n=1 Tax=Heterodera schachtii TaxID=97005 RepID=A0ABD2ISE6_HETSC
MRRFLACLFTIFIQNLFVIFGNCSEQKRPLPAVILPSVFHWEATNRIFVTPNLKGVESVDVSVKIQSENEKGQKNEFFNERQKGTRSASAFKVFVPKRDPSGALLRNFYVKIDVSGHQQFASVLAGTSDLRQMFIQTDKVFYRPGERVNVRALPLTSGGTPYKGNVQFNLLDPNGFRIFNKVIKAKAEGTVEREANAEKEKAKRGEGFLAEHFDLPKFLRFGEWKITAFAIENNGQKELVISNHFQRSIRVREYVVPKFHVFLSIEETLTAMSVKSVVSARFAHGLPVTGELTLRCSSANSLNISSDSFGSDQSPTFSASSFKKLLSTEFVSGLWSGKLDLSNCLGTLKSSTRIRIVAEVFERGTLQSATAQRDFDPFWSAFELLPMRPAFTENTTKLLFYLRPLSSLPFVLNGRAEIVAQCISEDKALNGLNQSSFHKLGTLAELETNRGCIVYIIRARRQLPNGKFSTAESVLIPALTGGVVKALDFSLIADQSPQNRLDYFEGEVMEVRVNSASGLNYAMTCDGGRDLVAMEPIGEDKRILVPIKVPRLTPPRDLLWTCDSFSSELINARTR